MTTMPKSSAADTTLHSGGGLDRNIALELCRVTEAAALAAARWMGRGNKNALDQAAVNAMRDRLRVRPVRPATPTPSRTGGSPARAPTPSTACGRASTRGARRGTRARRRPRAGCSASGSPTSIASTMGAPFRFYFCQREAVETFIYLTEIEPVRGLKDLLEFAEHGMTIQPGEPKRQRLAIKMATGSGKTMAMSLCIVWSYFHALYEDDSPMATSFLVIAPNVIVFERLKSDFGDAATFRRDPLVPPEWAHDFDLAVLLQDDAGARDRPRRAVPHQRPAALRAAGDARQEQDRAQPRRGDARSARQPRPRRVAPPRRCSSGSPTAAA